jgi:hypothetical protein
MNRPLLYAMAVATSLSCAGSLLFIAVPGEATTTVPASTPLEILISDIGFGEFVELDITDAQELDNQGVQPGDISLVELKFFELEATAPADADLSFITQLDVFVESPGLDRLLIATQDDFPAGMALVDMNIEDVDLTDYIVSENMTITTDVSGSRPSRQTEVTARYSLRVGVTAQGACNYIKGDGPEE